jgi:hypothetical protein
MCGWYTVPSLHYVLHLIINENVSTVSIRKPPVRVVGTEVTEIPRRLFSQKEKDKVSGLLRPSATTDAFSLNPFPANMSVAFRKPFRVFVIRSKTVPRAENAKS